MSHLLFLLVIFMFQDIPLKPTEEFEIKLDYNFRPRPSADPNTVRLDDSQKTFAQRTGQAVLPYLILHIKPLSLPEEKMRMRIVSNNNNKVTQKKVDVNTEVTLDLGFTDDMIDRVTAYEYTLTFLTSEKKAIDKIVIRIAEDGSFFVNGEKRGQF